MSASVTNHFSPLMLQPPSTRLRRGLEARDVGARVGLGDRVGVAPLAAALGLEEARALRGRAVLEHLRGAPDAGPERVRRRGRAAPARRPAAGSRSPGRPTRRACSWRSAARRARPGGCARSSPSRASRLPRSRCSNGMSHSSQKRRERSRISIRSGVRRRSTVTSFGGLGSVSATRASSASAPRGVTSRGLTSSSAISGCAAMASPSATTARAAAATSTAGRPRTPSSTAAVRSERSRRSAAAASSGASASAVSRSVSTRIPPRPTSTTAPKRGSRVAPIDELDAVAHVGGALDEEQVRREALASSRAPRRAASPASAQADAHAAGVRLVHEPGVDGLERDGVERELVGERDGLVGVARRPAVAVGDAGLEQQRPRLDVAGSADQRRGRRRRSRPRRTEGAWPARRARAPPARRARTRPGRAARRSVPSPTSSAKIECTTTGRSSSRLQRRQRDAPRAARTRGTRRCRARSRRSSR